jgi:hypothetical protein
MLLLAFLYVKQKDIFKRGGRNPPGRNKLTPSLPKDPSGAFYFFKKGWGRLQICKKQLFVSKMTKKASK